MSFFRGPQIVRDGLVLYLDAANTKSYPGTGTVWKDLSGNGNDGTLIGGVSFNDINNGSILFDGTNGRVSIPNPINQPNLEQEWTVSAWLKSDSDQTQELLAGFNDGLQIDRNTNNAPLLYLNAGDNDYYMYGEANGFIQRGWVLATFRFRNSDGTRTIYRNLSNISTSGPNKTSIPSGINEILYIGGSSIYLNGDLPLFWVYDRYITNNELTQNYNATKNRFSI